MIEIARQLEAAGEEIGAFAVLDYEMQRTPDDASPVRSAIAFARNLPRWVTDDAVPSGSRELVGRVKSRLRRAINRGAAADDIRDATGMWRFPDHQVEMLKVHHRVIHSFSPGPMNGRATLFLPRARPLFGPWTTGQDPGWERIARGGVDVEAVRGSHSTMLGGQFAAELAARLVACVERAELRLAATPAAVVDLP
jgi:thioesterase domain-containing protein